MAPTTPREAPTPQYDPNQRYLKQEETGAIFIWTEALSKRKDMRPWRPGDSVRRGLDGDFEPGAGREKIELQGKTFTVPRDLYDVLMEMGSVMVALQEENAALKQAAEGFEAFKERLTTDNQDLAEQLAKANEQLRLGQTVLDPENGGAEAAAFQEEAAGKGKKKGS